MAGDLGLGLPAAADHAERARPRPGEVPSRDAAGRPGAELSEPVGLDHCDQPPRFRVEEDDDERGRLGCGVSLEPGEAELPIDGGHDRERTVREAQPPARRVLDRPSGEAQQRRLHRLDRVLGRQERLDVGLREVERQGAASLGAGGATSARRLRARRRR